MKRSNAIVGLLAILAAVSAIGFALMLSYYGRDSCLDGFGEGGSCPTLAEVNGVRYGVSVAQELLDISASLSEHAPISRTNVPEYFSELKTYSIAGIDPSAVLVAPARAVLDQDVAPYRLLFGPNSKHAFPALCNYIPLDVLCHRQPLPGAGEP